MSQTLFPGHLYANANRMITDGMIDYLDFFRDFAFGFVRIDEKKGYYCRVSGQLPHAMNKCPCIEFSRYGMCSHCLALHQLFVTKGTSLGQQFASFIWTEALRAWRPQLRALKPLNLPTFQPFGLPIDQRILAAWDWQSDNPNRVKRDRMELLEAKKFARSDAEAQFILKGLLSPELGFEESALYPLAKWLFLLDQQLPLDWQVSLAETEVQVQVTWHDALLLEFQLPRDVYLKGIRGREAEWDPHQHFQVQGVAKPLVYRLSFRQNGALDIQPQVQLAGLWVPLTDLKKDASSSYQHPEHGIFNISHGLSEFELWAGLKNHRIDKEEVVPFLAKYRSDLVRLNTELFDPGILDRIVLTGFDQLNLHVNSMTEEALQVSFSVSLGESQLSHSELEQWKNQTGRYRFWSGRFFDTMSLEIASLMEWASADTTLSLSPIQFLQCVHLFGERMTLTQASEVEAQVQDLLFQSKSQIHSQLQLRDYQLTGLQWLNHLWSHRLGGLLCDQMGLGKTHQAMALIEQLNKRSSQFRVLIVSPLSVLYHWQEKLALYLPGTDVHVFYGPNRQASSLQKAGCTLTTYGTLRSDVGSISQSHYDLVLFDEIQNLKNDKTQNYQAASTLRAWCKIGLTGTPIENSIQDLRSLFEVVLPHYLGSTTHFNQTFRDPIIRGESAAIAKLQRMIAPFVLRRSKAEVLSELPPKIESLIHFDLGPEERKIYDQTLLEGRLALQSQEPTYLHVFQLIETLKRLCNHVALVHKDSDYSRYPSAKWSAFTELLESALEGGEKVVIFTQYLGMVDIFESYLKERGVGFAGIQGRTRNRDQEQKRFQNDPNCKVFIGSIHAAGSGIDLTAGTVMIHYDRWWNPAKEEQATDRIHRIGQTQPVTVYKLIANNTLEERIDKIIRNKKELLENIVEFDDQSLNKILSMQELMTMLEEADKGT
ncbi:MAG: DEAD/DEAH box helicase [Acidobacteria bacterium]|nr:DEAD/DEAH box helicase [Acidobacteriota bacterium]